MANKLEQIALKKKQAEADAREAEITALSKKIASEVVSNLSSLDKVETTILEGIIAGLSKSVSEAVVLSGEAYEKKLNDSFTQLLNAVNNNKPEKFDNTSNEKLFSKIGTALASLDTTLDSLELSPEIKLSAITKDELKTEVDRILSKLPENSKREVTIAYENAPSTRYLNVRLTDGINFYRAFGGGGGGSGTSFKNSSGNLEYVELTPDGKVPVEAVLGTTNYKTLIDKSTTPNVVYIGQAASGTATSTAGWQIKKIDKTVTDNVTITFAAAGAFTATWNNRGSEAYS